ncbi:MAG TPA: PAAR domain-containing protein [Candidatus Diapherotrites archaeon]|nr:PAAR domain-containing protein [Candidatus Diapherotrites archaeon]
MATPVTRIFTDTTTHGGVFITASSNVFTNKIPQVRQFDILACPIHGPNPVISNSPTVFVNNRNMTRIVSVCACGAMVCTGSPNVFCI